jgi:adenylate kinase family enzyme
MAEQVPLAVVLHGSIGVGKTTLGKALALHLGGSYIDGDQFQHAGRPWFASSGTVAGELVKAAVSATHTGAPAVLGYPLRCTDHILLKHRLATAGVRSFFVNLQAPLEIIVAPARGRSFTNRERQRMAEMIKQGYNSRPWSDAWIDTSGSQDRSMRRVVEALVEANLVEEKR